MKNIVLLLIFFITGFCFADSSESAAPFSIVTTSVDEQITAAYRILVKNGSYEEKKGVLKVLRDNYKLDRVVDIISNVLIYNYDIPNFKENDQDQYYDDVIAEELVKILGKNGSQKSFPALLRIVLYSKRHRDATVREAWNAIKNIRW